MWARGRRCCYYLQCHPERALWCCLHHGVVRQLRGAKQKLLTPLEALIKSNVFTTETIALKYFEPGKTFFKQKSINMAWTAIFCTLNSAIKCPALSHRKFLGGIFYFGSPIDECHTYLINTIITKLLRDHFEMVFIHLHVDTKELFV